MADHSGREVPCRADQIALKKEGARRRGCRRVRNQAEVMTIDGSAWMPAGAGISPLPVWGNGKNAFARLSKAVGRRMRAVYRRMRTRIATSIWLGDGWLRSVSVEKMPDMIE